VKLTRIEAFVTGRFNIYPEPSVCRILLALDPAVVHWSWNNWYLCRAVKGVVRGVAGSGLSWTIGLMLDAPSETAQGTLCPLPCVIGQRFAPSLLELRNKGSGIAENTPRQ